MKTYVLPIKVEPDADGHWFRRSASLIAIRVRLSWSRQATMGE